MSTNRLPTTAFASPSVPADLHQCLPAALQRRTPTITRIAAGMSGAGVYLVDAGDEQFVLKITPGDEPMAAWRTRLEVQQSAAAAGIAPSILHIDDAQRAVLSARIVDRSFVAHLRHPDTSDAAIVALGRMLRKRHDLPIPAGMELADPVRSLQAIWRTLPPGFTCPTFVRDAVDALAAAPRPARTDAVVMSHNDVNPTNLVFDGARVLLVDWETAAPNDALYDLATIALFVRLDEATCRQLVAAHHDAPVDVLPEAFRFFRRCAAVLSGVAALNAARLRGHTGGEIGYDATPSLGEVYQQLRSGTLALGSVSGQWTFGLALVKEGVTAWQ